MMKYVEHLDWQVKNIMPSKKVILFIVEGPTDETSLSRILKKISEDKKIHFHLVNTDITSEFSSNTMNIIKKINDEIKKSISKKYFKKSDIIQIIHIVDLDGTYIDPNNVVYHDNDKIEYCSDCIKTKNVQGTINRNNCKARILNKLSSTNIINGIPYRIFFFSTNLEHVLHNVQNATREEKNNLAQNFEDRFYDKPKEFIKFINNKDFAINKEYEETWNFIKKENNSLKRYTNFNLYFIDETK